MQAHKTICRNFFFKVSLTKGCLIKISPIFVKYTFMRTKFMLSNCGVGEDSRVPWTSRISNQSILKEISPVYSLEGLMLKLKLQYFGCLMERTDSLQKTLMLGKIEGRRRRGQQMMRWLVGITNLIDMSLSKLQGLVINKEARRSADHAVAKSWDTTEQLNGTELRTKLEVF